MLTAISIIEGAYYAMDHAGQLLLSAASVEYGVRREKFANPTDAVLKQAQIDLACRLPRLPEAPEVNWPRN
jgi:hypothetical protein